MCGQGAQAPSCGTRLPAIAHLLNEQPGVAGATKQGRLLQSMFKQGLEGWAEGPSHQVCDPLSHRVVPCDGILQDQGA